jgi:hypothetical protein
MDPSSVDEFDALVPKCKTQVSAMKMKLDTLLPRGSLSHSWCIFWITSMISYLARSNQATCGRKVGGTAPRAVSRRPAVGRVGEAEPLLIQGYQGMKASQKDRAQPHHGPPTSQRLSEVLERLVRLYDAWGKKNEADKWRTELEAIKPMPPDELQSNLRKQQCPSQIACHRLRVCRSYS